MLTFVGIHDTIRKNVRAMARGRGKNMKKAIAFLLMMLYLISSGCGTSSPGGDKPGNSEGGEASDSLESCPVSGTVHCDNANDGYCDLCGDYVVVLLDFYTLNDLHGKFADGDTHPGVDELTTYLKNAREKDDVAFFLSAGDMWQGSAESNNTQGFIITDWMNALDFDAMTLGNHEYDWGEAAIEGNAEIAEFPFLAINVYDRESNTRVDYCEASLLVDRGGIQVGIVGAMGDCYSSIATDKTQDIYFITGSQLTTLVKEEAARLRSQGADFIVYVIHDGYGDSKTAGVTDVSGNQLSSYYDVALSDGSVDLVFEGHTHQRYVLKDRYGVYHMQSGGENKGLAHVEIALNVANGQRVVNTAEFVSNTVYRDMADDPVVKELMNKYAAQIEDAMRVVGRTSRYRSSTELRNLVAKLYYQVGQETWGDAYDIVLGGGFISVRNPYELPAGEVTYATLQSIFPFDNDLVLCSIKGRDLISRFIQTSNNNYYIYMGGKSESEVVKSIDPNGTYYIITDTYCSGYAPNKLTVVEKYTPGIYARDLLADYIAAGGME